MNLLASTKEGTSPVPDMLINTLEQALGRILIKHAETYPTPDIVNAYGFRLQEDMYEEIDELVHGLLKDIQKEQEEYFGKQGVLVPFNSARAVSNRFLERTGRIITTGVPPCSFVAAAHAPDLGISMGSQMVMTPDSIGRTMAAIAADRTVTSLVMTYHGPEDVRARSLYCNEDIEYALETLIGDTIQQLADLAKGEGRDLTTSNIHICLSGIRHLPEENFEKWLVKATECIFQHPALRGYQGSLDYSILFGEESGINFDARMGKPEFIESSTPLI
jgi:hypothetical protein